MLTKNFEKIVRFFECPVDGRSIWLPLVRVTLVTPTQNRVSLSLLFDTGASVTTLRADLYPMLGLQSWDQGQRVEIVTAGGMAVAYQYTYSLEILGKTIECPIQLAQMPPNPLFNGLLGRDAVFDQFGFGFWEGVHELYATSTP
jgi:predicted aspartyl protease